MAAVVPAAAAPHRESAIRQKDCAHTHQTTHHPPRTTLTSARVQQVRTEQDARHGNETQQDAHAATNIAHGMECSCSPMRVCTPLAGSSGSDVTNIVTREDHKRHELLQEADLMQNTESHFSIFHVLGSDANVCTMAQ